MRISDLKIKSKSDIQEFTIVSFSLNVKQAWTCQSNVQKAPLLISFPNKLTKTTNKTKLFKNRLCDAKRVKYRIKAKTELSLPYNHMSTAKLSPLFTRTVNSY